jgi:hypothetical protein
MIQDAKQASEAGGVQLTAHSEAEEAGTQDAKPKQASEAGVQLTAHSEAEEAGTEVGNHTVLSRSESGINLAAHSSALSPPEEQPPIFDPDLWLFSCR